ncbi:MAG TPA: ABC transporter ATP-binding protein [Thermoanaerobacterales bacterium]|nr:ABC transporter ATP-binding protein [Thermoanaerobacterales bacterium]
MPLFQVRDLHYYYPESEKPALKGINISVEEGEFVLVTGGSGSGKSTLARALAGLVPDFYGGVFRGEVLFRGRNIRCMDRRKLYRHVGMVFQDPEKQLVKTEAEAEIAFGLENLGLPQQEMFRRVAEVMDFLDLKETKGRFVDKLSGGQKQKIALASVLAMQPEAIILDEPTSQLDPASAEELLNLIKRLNEEMGKTIVLVEQRLERCFHMADRVAIMKDGELTIEGTPRDVAAKSIACGIHFIPPVTRFFTEMGFSRIPITVKEGRRILKENIPQQDSDAEPIQSTDFSKSKQIDNGCCPDPASLMRPDFDRNAGAILELKNVWFSYKDKENVLQEINLEIFPGEFLAILGANGAGKSTLLKIMSGLLVPDRGRVLFCGNECGKKREVYRCGKVAYLSQNPNDYLFQDTVEQELCFTLKNFGIPDGGRIDRILDKLDLKQHKNKNPRDLSSGERQRVALASVLVIEPVLVLLDEPTRGMDYGLKAALGTCLAELDGKKLSIVMVTHDVEFAAEHAKRVIILHDGKIASDGPAEHVLGNSIYYSTQMARMCKGFARNILTVEDAIKRLGPVLTQNRQAFTERGSG